MEEENDRPVVDGTFQVNSHSFSPPRLGLPNEMDEEDDQPVSDGTFQLNSHSFSPPRLGDNHTDENGSQQQQPHSVTKTKKLTAKERKAKKVAAEKKRLESESPEQRDDRLKKKRLQAASSRANELDNTVSRRRKRTDVEHKANSRDAESPAAKRMRLQQDSGRHRVRYASDKQYQTKSKAEYLQDFNSSVNGPLHEQEFLKKEMKNFHEEIAKLNCQHCSVCKELWPTTDAIVDEYVCSHCRKETDGHHKLGAYNDMIRDLDLIPEDILLKIRQLTMIEEMLLSPVLPIMTVYKLPSGGTVSKGFVANFHQESVQIIKQIPLHPSKLPVLVIRRKGQGNVSKDFKVNRERVAAVGQFLIHHHKGFVSHKVTFSSEICNQLPQDGFIHGVATIETEEDEQETVDEGPMARDVHTENEDEIPPDHTFVAGMVIQPPQADQIKDTLHNPLPSEPSGTAQHSSGTARNLSGTAPLPSEPSGTAQNPLPWPTIDPKAINEFEQTGLASLAFPKLFPLGQADPTATRLLKVTESHAAAHLLKYAELDPAEPVSQLHPSGQLYYPFAEHERFMFWMADRIRRHRALSQAKVYFRQNPRDEALTMDQLKDMIHTGEIKKLVGRIYAYTANIVGSDAYWAKRKRELRAIMEQKGLGTAFFTFSFADYHWQDMHRLMPGGLLDPKSRYKNALRHPHLADWFFSHRLNIFIKHFFQGALDRDWIWHRYEWQSRSAIHAHGVVKLKNDPGIAKLVARVYAGRNLEAKLKDENFVSNKTEQELQNINEIIAESKTAETTVINYANTIVTAFNTRLSSVNLKEAVVPDPHPCSKDITNILHDTEAMDTDYEDLANCVQRHVCRINGYCKSKTKNQCRFHYPMQLQNETKLEFEVCGNSVKAKITFKRNDDSLNVHNRTMLQHWRANVDIQLILDPYAAINYMAKYASKSERSGNSLQSIIRTIIQKADDNDNTASAIRSAIIKSIGNRDIGQGETSRFLLSGHHCETTLKFVTASLELDVHRLIRNKDGSVSQEVSLLKMFGDRHRLIEEKVYPADWDLDQPNFIEFCKNFRVQNGVLKKQTDIHRLVVVTFPNVRKCSAEKPEYVTYCRSSVVKYYPWTTTSIENILDDEKVVHMWKRFESSCPQNIRAYFEVDQQLDETYLDVAADIERELNEDDILRNYGQEQHQEDWQEAAQMRPVGEHQPITDPIIDNDHDWIQDRKIAYSESQLQNGSKWVKDNIGIQLPEESCRLPHVDRSQLNEMQKFWFDTVLEAQQNNQQLLLIVIGVAGTGKTHTIAAISHAIPENQIIRCAYTAKAAFLVRGKTLHTAFRIPVESRNVTFGELNAQAKAQFEMQLEHVKFIIIDEFSMISQDILGKIDFRLREAKCNNNLFGGVSVILVGDPAQLPPVCAPPLYGKSRAKLAAEGYAAYLQFKKVIHLTEMCRQIVQPGDNEQLLFVELLNDLRNGKFSIQQWKLLQSRDPNKIENFEQEFQYATRLHPTNAAVDERNFQKIAELKTPITVLKSINTPKNGTGLPADNFRGLPNQLYLAVEAEITLTTNINSAHGLNNRTQGKVVDIVYMPGSKPNHDLPEFVTVRIPHYIGPQFFEKERAAHPGDTLWNCIPIGPMVFSNETFTHERKQFPFRLAYATTTHSSQGETFENKAVVDIGAKEIAPGQSYVALSRVKHIRDLAVLPFNYERLARLEKSTLLKARLQEEDRLHQLALQTLANK